MGQEKGSGTITQILSRLTTALTVAVDWQSPLLYKGVNHQSVTNDREAPYRFRFHIAFNPLSRMIFTNWKCVTVFWKTDRIDTNTEILFMPVHESHTHALFRDTKH